MLFESPAVVKTLVLGALVFLLSAVAVVVFRSAVFSRLLGKWKVHPLVGRFVVTVALVGLIAFGGTKPGSGGDDTGGDGPAVTNQVDGASGDLQGDGQEGGRGGSPRQDEETHSTSSTRQAAASTDGNPGNGLDVLMAAAGSAESSAGRIALGNYEAGFVLQRVGTNETFDFTAPDGALVSTNWMLHGAATAHERIRLADWTFPFGDTYVTNLTAFSYGVASPDVANPNVCFAPFAAPLGVVPSANWHLLPTNCNQTIKQSNNSNNSPVSVFWRTMTDDNALVLTWQNVLLDRLPGNPISFQMELRPGGEIVYRYDLTNVKWEMENGEWDAGKMTNVVIGVSAGAGSLRWNLAEFAADFSFSIFNSPFSIRFQRVTTADLDDPDRDGDGVETEAEIFDYGTNPNAADTDFDGIPDGVEIAAGTNPRVSDITDAEMLERVQAFSTNAAETVTYVTNSLVSWKLFDAFAANLNPQPSTLNSQPLWTRTFRIDKTSPWQQYFVSAAPDSAAGWMLEGMCLEWEDSLGNTGTLTRSPSGDSYRLPLSTNDTASVTLRLRATGSHVRSSSPLYLIAYVPEFKVNGGNSFTGTDGIEYSVFTDGSDSQIGLEIDRTHRPCHAGVLPEESDLSVFEEMAETPGDFEYEGDVQGGAIFARRPGVYTFPAIEAKISAAPRVMPNGPRFAAAANDGGRRIVVLSPSVGWTCNGNGCSWGGLGYDWGVDWYYEESDYPLDSPCLRSKWHYGYGGDWRCDGEFYCSSGIGDGNGVGTGTDGNRGTVSVGGVEVWSGTAEHVHDHFCGGGDSLESEGCCGDCRDGNCDAYEGTSLGSLKFRIPLGNPSDGMISGFAYFDTNGPISIDRSTLLLKMHPSADYTDSWSAGVRTVACHDRRGRTLVIESISGGIRVTVRVTSDSSLEHTWEITNVGSPSVVRLRQISRLDNVMKDETFTCDEGDWTRFDNIAQVGEELVVEGGVNDSDWSGVKRETRTTTDAAGNVLKCVVTEQERIGECENAVLRETYREERTGRNWVWSSADYWNDPQHPARHGRLRLARGTVRSWAYHDYDGAGRETVRVEQRNGSEVPTAFPTVVSNVLYGVEGLADATVTTFDYAVIGGDDEHIDDAAKPRTETKYVVRGGTATPVARTWRRYTRTVRSGYDAVKVETWRACDEGAGQTDAGNAYSYEITFADSDGDTPRAMRDQVVESLDENGILTQSSYSISGNVVSQSSHKSHSSHPFPTYEQTDFDANYGNILRTATYLTANDTLLAEEISTYDTQNRLRSTTYSDGTSLTNAYSCCRLLWKRDREGRKTLRSAVTGHDHLYNAEEEVWLGEIENGKLRMENGEWRWEGVSGGPTNGFKVTQHFFDALGRETNTTVGISYTPGSSTSPTSILHFPFSIFHSSFPCGGSDFAIHTDERGVVTITRRDPFDNATEESEEIQTNGVRVSVTKRRTVFGGGTSTRREWGDREWTEESRFSDYAADGSRIDYVVTESHDCGTVTNSIAVYDWLGREVSRSVPGANGVRIETRKFYDGTSARLVRAATDGSPDVVYAYDDRGELLSTTQNGIVNRSVTTYETVSGEVWRVRTTTRESGSAVNSTSIERVQLTGLSDALRSRRVSVSPSNVTRSESSCDATGLLTTVSQVDGCSPETSVSRCGLVVSTTSIDGSETYGYDERGRKVSASSFAVGGSSPRSCETYRYNAFGDLVETMTDLGAEGCATASAAYDLFGRVVSRTDPSGGTVTTEYDGLGRVLSVGGDTYPLKSGYDSVGRKTVGSTTRDGGQSWDATTWTYDPASGLNTTKLYADGSQIAYGYIGNGKKTRTTWARGAWKENAYDAANRISSTSYSDGTPSITYAYTAAGKVSEAATTDCAHYLYGYDSRLLCTNETVVLGADRFEVLRSYDERNRCDSFAVDVTNVAHAVKTRSFDSEGRVAGYGFTNYCGHGITATLQHDGSRLVNVAYTLPNGGTFACSLMRSVSRPDLVTRRDYHFGNGSIYWYETGYDLAGRPTNAVDSVSLARAFLYNRRNEIAEAIVGTNALSYAYDSIGNRTTASANNVTNFYVTNSLNQYTTVGHAAPSAPQATFAYDADGNLTADDRFAYTYDAENRHVSVRPINPSEGDLAVVNAYDHDNRRVVKRVERFDGSDWQTRETHTFVYDGGNIALELIETSDGSTRTVECFWGNDLSGNEQGAGGVGGLLAVSVDGAFYIPCYDHNGNVVCYVSESGVIAAQYVYDPYGNVIEQHGNLSDEFAFRFSTKYYDCESGMVSYQRRFYRPDHGRWLNRDPIEEGGGENLYTFCENNPVFLFDRGGLSCKVDTYNVLRLDTWDKPLANGLASNPDFINNGGELLSSIGTLGDLMALSSLSPSSLANFQSFVDAVAGRGMTPNADVMARLRELYNRLKRGPIMIYGVLEYEVCVCKGKKTDFERQEDIFDNEEVLDGSDHMQVQAMRQVVVKYMISEMFSRIKKLR